MINSFRGQYEFLSNFYVELDGKTAEHRFQAAKADNLADYLHVLNAPTPTEAKRRGRKISMRADWERRKVRELRAILWVKFQNPQLRAWLLDTGGQDLIEGNVWHDNYWGDCLCKACEDIPGQNWLGYILMRLRDGLVIDSLPMLH